MQRTRPVVNIVFAGLGGQGVLRASDIAAQAALSAGFDVKKSEIHGMSQRGGFVTSDVRFGGDVASPMVPPGEAHYLVVIEPTQLDAARDMLRPGGVLIVADELTGLPASSRKCLNVALLGMLSAHLDISEEIWTGAICASLPEKFHQMNLQAFCLGRSQAMARA